MFVALPALGFPPGVTASPEPTTSNQSLAIEGAPAAPAPATTNATPPRSVRRKPGAALSGVLTDDGDTPWYRTGLGALGIVMGCVAIVFLIVRRWAPSVRAPDSGLLKVLGRAGLTPKHSLAVVQFGRRFVLIGLSPDGVSALSEVSDGDEAAELAGRTEARLPADANGFDELLTGEASEFATLREPPPAERPAVRNLLRRLESLQTKGG
jgi:flagellar biogenesis protein FliO